MRNLLLVIPGLLAQRAEPGIQILVFQQMQELDSGFHSR